MPPVTIRVDCNTRAICCEEARCARRTSRRSATLAGEALAAGGALVREMHEGIARRPVRDPGRRRGPRPRRPRRRRRRRVRRRRRGAARGRTRRGGGGRPRRRATPRPPWPRARGRRWPSRPSTASTATTSTARGNALAFGMGFRRHGTDVDATAAGLATAFPDATSRLAVFVHGLGETDAAWRLAPRRAADRTDRRTYGERLQDELSFTPLHLRYNTGLRISRQRPRARPPARRPRRGLARRRRGASSSSATRWAASWPAAPATTATSRGGAGPRPFATCSASAPRTSAPTSRRASTSLGWALGRLPETRPWGDVLNARSAGIKDLRFGACVEEDWSGCEDPDEFLRDRCQEVPFLPGAHYYFVGATLRERARRAPCSATCSSACPARRGAGTAGAARSRSRSRTAASSPA